MHEAGGVFSVTEWSSILRNRIKKIFSPDCAPSADGYCGGSGQDPAVFDGKAFACVA